MSLIHSARKLMNYANFVPSLITKLYDEFGALDTRVTNLEGGHEIVPVAITVATGTSSGSSSANSAIEAGEILSIVPNGNQDQFVSNVALNSATGAVTVTLAQNATAANKFIVNVLV